MHMTVSTTRANGTIMGAEIWFRATKLGSKAMTRKSILEAKAKVLQERLRNAENRDRWVQTLVVAEHHSSPTTRLAHRTEGSAGQEAAALRKTQKLLELNEALYERALAIRRAAEISRWEAELPIMNHSVFD